MSLPQTCFLQKKKHKRQFQTKQVEYSKVFVFLATHKQHQSAWLKKLQSVEHKMFHSLLQFQKINWFHKNLIRKTRYKIGLSLPSPALSVIFELFCQYLNCLLKGWKDLGSYKCKDQFSEKNTASDRIFMQFALSAFIIHIRIFFYTTAWQKALNRKLSGKKHVIKDILALNPRQLFKPEFD